MMKMICRVNVLLSIFCCIRSLTAVSATDTSSSNETDLPMIQASAMLPLTPDKIKIVNTALKLSKASFNSWQAYEMGADYFNTGADAALTLQTGSYCFVAFRGSLAPKEFSPDVIEDWVFENFDFDHYYLRNRENTPEGCVVQEGFYEAYSGVGTENINDFVDNCMSNGGKQLILTGHSQGGAAAAVAAIVNSEYNPLTITFGQPPILANGENCHLLNKDHIWRFINTESSSGGIRYDAVAFAELVPFGVFGAHVGASVHLSPDLEDSFSSDLSEIRLVYRSVNETNAFMNLDDLDIIHEDSNAAYAHDIDRYLVKIKYLTEYGTDPLLVDGYSLGTKCTEDFECSTSVMTGAGGCVNKQCSEFLSTDKCDRGTDCVSGRCEYTWSGTRECFNKKSNGSPCNEDNDCQSGDCSWWFLCE